MGYHPRIESKLFASFLTTRSRNSELWFVNNNQLDVAILGYAAKFRERYNVHLYGIAIEGNHIHAAAHFTQHNRASFMRDLNSCIARAIPRYCADYSGGRYWARRYSSEFLPGPEDIEDYFFYIALQSVQDGLVDRISDYPGYNCFHDAVHGISRKFKVNRWAEYNAAKRRSSLPVYIADFTDYVTLTYSRIPGYEDLSQTAYAKLMYEKLEKRRVEIIQRRGSESRGCMGKEKLLRTKPGSLPRSTKTSDINSRRPRVLSHSMERRIHCLGWYFGIYFDFKYASNRYRRGITNTKFPDGTYRPYLWLVPPQKKEDVSG